VAWGAGMADHGGDDAPRHQGARGAPRRLAGAQHQEVEPVASRLRARVLDGPAEALLPAAGLRRGQTSQRGVRLTEGVNIAEEVREGARVRLANLLVGDSL